MDNNIGLIEAYLNGELSVDERREFENRLVEDEMFAKDYKDQLAARQLIKEAGRLDLKDTLESFEVSGSDSKVRPLWLKRAIPIAAMLVIFFGVYYFLEFNQGSGGLYDSYFESYPAPANLRDTSSEDSAWNDALESYENEDFEQALNFMGQVRHEAPGYMVAFYVGLSAMQTEPAELEKAMSSFDSVLRGDNDYKEQALWYKGLILIKLERTDEAIDVLTELTSRNGFKKSEASQILDKLTD